MKDVKNIIPIAHIKKNLLGMALLFTTLMSQAAISLDQTRIIFNNTDKSASVVLKNKSETLPHLALSWLENVAGQKVDSPLVVVPRAQRIEAGKKGLVRIMKLPEANKLPTDRETLFYFNVREVPPKSNMPNTVQIAIQNRVKLFYRPASLNASANGIWQERLQLSKQGGGVKIYNPTPYYITIGYLSQDHRGNFPGFDSVMIAPFSTESVKTSGYRGNHYSLGYINDFGGMVIRTFNCSGVNCQIQSLNGQK
ncbi:fimbrial biogenesis chaperone [Yersinia aldovae]|uniref:Fimbrial chaperone n=1 Tax=Yersinia aldovae TaxID=29483 RepID=A0ABM9SPJ6_YERAL|nr:fimbria/pilus periplasmic chaperone [Yersinia aldovae]CNJ38558.1 fimbrial chaperone [Yersinia aldovae]CNK60325.1 fimbrial chaperone [Yersinia aldovae]